MVHGERPPKAPERACGCATPPTPLRRREGWVILGAPGQELALGLVGRFWRPVIDYAEVTPEGFRDFTEPGYAKTVYALSVRPLDRERSVLSAVMRTATTYEHARSWFRRYWTYGRGSGAHILVHALLDLVRESAERAAHPPTPTPDASARSGGHCHRHRGDAHRAVPSGREAVGVCAMGRGARTAPRPAAERLPGRPTDRPRLPRPCQGQHGFDRWEPVAAVEGLSATQVSHHRVRAPTSADFRPRSKRLAGAPSACDRTPRRPAPHSGSCRRTHRRPCRARSRSSVQPLTTIVSTPSPMR